MGVARPGAPSMMTSPVTSRRIFNNFRAETDRAQPGRFGPTRCGPVCIRSLKILLLVSQDTVISGKKKANAQLNNQVGNGTLGYKKLSSKIITKG